MFYQDFKDTFVCNTQQFRDIELEIFSCFIRISKILLYAIHNISCCDWCVHHVVLSGFQRYFCMQYTTSSCSNRWGEKLFYQDFKDTFVCNTQHNSHITLAIQVVLSGFQRYFCMQYTTHEGVYVRATSLFYQDFKDTFVCNTQPIPSVAKSGKGCFIRISKILLYAIHNCINI